jgi:hypothetical protein
VQGGAGLSPGQCCPDASDAPGRQIQAQVHPSDLTLQAVMSIPSADTFHSSMLSCQGCCAAHVTVTSPVYSSAPERLILIED